MNATSTAPQVSGVLSAQHPCQGASAPHVTKCLCVQCAGGLWEQDPEKTKSQLRGYLAGSKAQWKLVTGHHPISSFGSHCAFSMANDCAQMAWLEPELNVSRLMTVCAVWWVGALFNKPVSTALSIFAKVGCRLHTCIQCCLGCVCLLTAKAAVYLCHSVCRVLVLLPTLRVMTTTCSTTSSCQTLMMMAVTPCGPTM